MFQDCASLTQAPELPATTLANYCYCSMFNSCKSLTQAPALLATTLVTSCYFDMFSGCTNIQEPKYRMHNLTFNEVANAIRNTEIFNIYGGTYEVQCSDKILIATFDERDWQWVITEK
jgi:hypothetical protein